MQEGVSGGNLKLLKMNLALLLVVLLMDDLIRHIFPTLSLVQSKGGSSNVLVFSILLRLEELDLHLSVILLLA